MRSAWVRMRTKEILAGRLIVAGRPVERVDEAHERCQWRAQFVRGIGDEIGAHTLKLLLAGQIAQHNDGCRLAQPVRAADGGNEGFEAPLHRYAVGEFDLQGVSAG